MKTFDEVFDKMCKSKEGPQLISASEVEASAYMENKGFVNIIGIMAAEGLTSLAMGRPGEEAANLAGLLHTMFHLGVLVGKEMEKPDENI